MLRNLEGYTADHARSLETLIVSEKHTSPVLTGPFQSIKITILR